MLSGQLPPRLVGCQRFVKNVINHFLWVFHLDKLKIPLEQRRHYKRIYFKTRRSLGYSPQIFRGDGFNDKIKWLMIFRQEKKQIEWCDKLRAKEVAKRKLGAARVPKLFDVAEAYEELDFSLIPENFVLKCTHDSGSVWILKKSDIQHKDLGKEVNRKLEQVFGWDNGEWYYSYVKPKVLAEEYLEYKGGPPADYKFHCSNGNVLCCQYIYNRHDQIPSEIMLAPDGSYLGFHLGNQFVRGCNFSTPEKWREMLDIAQSLSKDEPYIRIDLYLSDDGVKFGEFSWHPRSGNYKGVGGEILGGMIYLDRSKRNRAIVTR